MISDNLVWVVLSWAAGQCPEVEAVFRSEQQAWLFVDAEARAAPDRFFRVSPCEIGKPA